MTSPLIAINNLRHNYGTKTVLDLDRAVIPPGTTALLGPNGAGKTTLLRLLSTVTAPSPGTVLIDGADIAEPANRLAIRRRLGYASQLDNLPPRMRVSEYCDYVAALKEIGPRRRRQRWTEYILGEVSLTDHAEDRISTLSGGMRRRLVLAQSLLGHPEMLVLDEPTVGVDPQSRNQILDSVEILGGEGLSVLYTTHYMEEAERLCDRIGVLDHGKMIAEGTQDELVARVGEQDLIIISGDYDESLVNACAALAGADHAELTSRGIEVLSLNGTALLGPLVALFGEHSAVIGGLQLREPNLEAVFLDLTGRALRD